MDRAAETVARNNATFREANEKIRDAAADAPPGLVPFICECADPGCTDIVRLSLRDYEHIRAQPTRFLNAAGHEASAGRHVEVVEQRDGYVVVEKVGEAAAIVKSLDTRVRPK